MYVQRYSAQRSHNHCCHGNATIGSIFVVGVDFAAAKSVQCCHANATVGSLCTLVELRNIFRTAV